ncbi:MAG: hypothetical protein ACOCWG_02020, partial [bacterium]
DIDEFIRRFLLHVLPSGLFESRSVCSRVIIVTTLFIEIIQIFNSPKNNEFELNGRGMSFFKGYNISKPL